MPNTNIPKDGGFESYLDATWRKNIVAPEFSSLASDVLPQEGSAEEEALAQVLVEGQLPTDEFLEHFNALQTALALFDEEFERQALAAPGDDGDPSTPE